MQLSTLLISSLLLVGESIARPSPRHVSSLNQRSHHDKAKRQVEAQRFRNGRNRFGRPNFGGNFGSNNNNNNNNGGGAGASSSVAAPVASASVDPAAPASSEGADPAAGDTADQNGGNDGAAGGDTGGAGGDVPGAGGDTDGNGDQADAGAGGEANGGGDAANGNGAGNGDQAAGGDGGAGGEQAGGNGGGDAAAGGNGGNDQAAGGNGGGDAAGGNGGDNGGNGENANDGNGGNANDGNGGNANGGNGNGGNGGGGNGNGNAGNADDQADDQEVANDAGANAQQPGPAVPVLISNGGQTLNQDLIMNTQANPNATAGQAASATSNNNFIDFCQGQTLTNGLQVKEGSCAVTPIGQIPSTQNMVSTMFVVPANGDTLPADQTFTMQLAVQGLVMGSFTNAQLNYYSAPQQVDGSGRIVGHAHVVIQEMTSTTSTQVLNPQQFAFFKGLNFQDVNGVSSLAVDGGLPRGAYRICTIMSASNHQSVVMPVAQRGAENTCSYFNTN